MGYVKTAEELAAFQSDIQGMTYHSDGLEVGFTTTREFLREALPPCFEVPDAPRGIVRFGSSVGSGGIAFYSCSIYVSALLGDILGWYDLAMLFTGDMTVTLGRELWGESKKRAQVGLESDFPNVHAYAERNGTRLIDVAATDFGTDLGSRSSARTFFHLKAYLNTDATDLEWDPIVFVLDSSTEHHTYFEGTGSLTFQSSDADPCGTIPVVSIDNASYGNYQISYVDSQHQPVGREGYLPYVIGRSYDLSHTPE